MARLLRKKPVQKAKSVKSTVEEVEEAVDGLEEESDWDAPIDPNMLVPTPSIPFNLECSSRPEGAFLLGKIVNLIGDSHAGKTLFALSILSECAQLARFDNYRFIYDDVEAACEFNIGKLFGAKVKKRLETETRSKTIEDFNDNIARAISDDKRPFIYILDSFDALTSEAAVEKDLENRKKREKGNDVKGSYGDGKAKIASGFFALRTQGLSDKLSIIIIISQTRDNIGFGAQFTPKVRSGGKALKFYSFHEVWLAVQKREKKGARTYITNVQAKITKNKLVGRHGEASFPILFDYGVDNITSCINFLVTEKYWTPGKGCINTKGFHPNKEVSYKELVKYIEDNDLMVDLGNECKLAYDAAIDELVPKHRKRKY